MVQDVNEFLLLGSSTDTAPGEALDKAARTLGLHVVRPEWRTCSGGAAMEALAGEGGHPAAVDFPSPRMHHRDCNFSFTGLKTSFDLAAAKARKDSGHEDNGSLLANAADLAASFQYALARHICHRLQRAFEFCERLSFWPDDGRKTLVVSGGVAANAFFKKSFLKVIHRSRI